ncbi:MAG: serine hydrolase [Nakamurella sp.]
MQQLAASSGPSAAEAQQHFDATFLKQAPAAQLSAIFDQLRANGPYALNGFGGTTASAQATLTGKGSQRYLMSIAVDSAGLISGLLVKPGRPLPTVNSLTDLDSALKSVGINASESVFTVGNAASCTTTHSFGDQSAHPLGSMFKLYVLGAVVQAVKDGRLSWDKKLTVSKDVKSLPSGQLQDAPDGTKVTVQHAAELMISISDNTAADMLIAAVGRPAVEKAVVAMHASHPTLLTPFLTTRQMFTLDGDPQLRAAWARTTSGLINPQTGAVAPPAAAQVTAREKVLTQLPAGPPSISGLSGKPGWTDGLEWYASATDLCRAHAALQAMAATPAGKPVQQILSKNPGVDVGTAWKYVAFKGGSDNGVLGGSGYLQAKDGSSRVLVAQLSSKDASKIPDDEWFAVALGGAIRSLSH